MFCGPHVQARLAGQAERACSAVADEEEAVTAPVPSKATEIIVKLRLRRLGFDLHPGRLSDCRLSEDQVHVRPGPCPRHCCAANRRAQKSNRPGSQNLASRVAGSYS